MVLLILRVTLIEIVLLDKEGCMYKVDNAVILAAGLSSRFTPFCMEKPKPLWRISGEILIERIIRQLKEKGINDIYIVIGHEAEMFAYLTNMFDGVKLVLNHDYAKTNNLISLEKVFNVLNNSIVVSSDLYFKNNLFCNIYDDSIYTSVYMSPINNERLLITDDKGYITNTLYDPKQSGWVSFGYAFFSEIFSSNIKNIFNSYLSEKEETSKLFWADVQDKFLGKLKMKAMKVKSEDIFEFDSFDDMLKYGIEHIAIDKNGRVSQMLESLGIKLNEIVSCSRMDLSDKSFVLNTKSKTYKINI